MLTHHCRHSNVVGAPGRRLRSSAMSTGGQVLPTGPRRDAGTPACPLLSPTAAKFSCVGQQLFFSLESFTKVPETGTGSRSIHERQQSPARCVCICVCYKSGARSLGLDCFLWPSRLRHLSCPLGEGKGMNQTGKRPEIGTWPSQAPLLPESPLLCNPKTSPHS